MAWRLLPWHGLCCRRGVANRLSALHGVKVFAMAQRLLASHGMEVVAMAWLMLSPWHGKRRVDSVLDNINY
jgi:hypothetical protein